MQNLTKLKKLKNKKGFTLIEMLIVILIIVILLAIAVPAVAAYRRDALRTQDEGAVETIRTAIQAAVIRTTPDDNGSSYFHLFNGYHVGVNLDYDRLVSISNNTSLDQETRDFYGLLAGYLGPNFQGNFTFCYDVDNPSGDRIDWVSYWRSDSATANDSVMFYHEYFQNGGDKEAVEAARNMIYLSELYEIEDPGSYLRSYYGPRTDNIPASAP